MELIDRAALLDTRRRPRQPPTDHNKVDHLNHKPQRNTHGDDAAVSRGDGRGDDTLEPQRPSRGYKPPNCYNCNEPGHPSRQCSRPKSAATIRAQEHRAGRANDPGGRSATGRQANCFLKSTGGSLPIVTGFVNNRPVRVCIDSGANVSILSESAVGPEIRSHPWTTPDEIQVLNHTIKPEQAAALDIAVGTTHVHVFRTWSSRRCLTPWT